MISVMEVMDDLGVEKTKKRTSVIGARVAYLYEMHTGKPPKKDLRPKTSGHGTHCFALYEEEWRPLITEVIKRRS